MAAIESRIVTYGVREVREIKATSAEVGLIRPMLGGTTQADANENFKERIDQLETAVDQLETEINGGSFRLTLSLPPRQHAPLVVSLRFSSACRLQLQRPNG